MPASQNPPPPSTDPETILSRLGIGSTPDDIESGDDPAPPNALSPQVLVRASPSSGSDLHLTERQAAWIATRLRVEDDLVACMETGVSADEVIQWRSSPVFNEAVASYLTDKRGAFRPLASHLLPLAWTVIQGLLSSPAPRDRKDGAKLLLQAQGLLINVQETTQSDELRQLLADLQRPVPVDIIDIPPRP